MAKTPIRHTNTWVVGSSLNILTMSMPKCTGHKLEMDLHAQ